MNSTHSPDGPLLIGPRRSVRGSLVGACLMLLSACGTGGGGVAGSGGGGGGGGGAPPDSGQLLPTVGLTSAAAGDASGAASDGVIGVRWDARDPDGAPVAVGLFLSTSKATLYQGLPVHTATGAGKTLLGGLLEDQPYWLGLAVDLGGGQYSPAGAQMSATPGTVFYVDAASQAVNPDGATPATAFSSLIEGALVASSLGSIGIAANVWVAGGTYTDIAVPLGAGVHVYGGFKSDFDLATRNPLLMANRSVLHAQPGKAVIEIAGGDAGAILDGFEIEGAGATFGVDIDTSAARISSLEIHDCTGRGVRLRSLSTTSNYRVTLANCSVLRSGAEGLSLQGNFKLEVEGSRFSSNGLEGLDLDDLVAPDGLNAKLEVRDSVFFGNGEEGLDCDLGAPPLPGGASNYVVTIAGSHFESNGWKPSLTPLGGLTIDIEFEAFPGWSADIVVRGCTARANRGNGIHLDLDSTSTTLLHRVLSSANGGDGLLVSSETATSLACVSTSVFTGNQGAGVRVSGGLAGGNVPVLLSHSILAGNGTAGLSSGLIESSAVSSVGWLQTAPFGGAGGVRQRGTLSESDPQATLFMLAPAAYRSVTAFDGTTLTLDDTSALAPGDLLEFADDGAARTLTGLVGPGITVDVPPASLDLPALATRFEVGSSVAEDWQLAPGSAAVGAGMPPPAGPAPDAGIFGAPLGGLPGHEAVVSPALFAVAACSPPTTTALATSGSISVTFSGGTLDSLSIAGNVQVRRQNGQVVSMPMPTLQGDALVIQPPGSGWPVGQLTLELFDGLESIAVPAVGLVAPLVLPFNVQ